MTIENSIKILELLISWPVAAIIIVVLLKRYVYKFLDRIIDSENSELEIGPIKAKLGELVDKGSHTIDDLEKLQILMAETRLTELKFHKENSHRMGFFVRDGEIESQILALEKIINSNKSKQRD